MVVPNRDFENKQFSPSAFIFFTSQIAHLLANLAMDINKNNKVNNYDDVRGRSPSSSNISSKSVSVVLKTFSISYHKRIVINNNVPDEEFRKPIDSFQLSYKDKSQANSHINMAICYNSKILEWINE